MERFYCMFRQSKSWLIKGVSKHFSHKEMLELISRGKLKAYTKVKDDPASKWVMACEVFPEFKDQSPFLGRYLQSENKQKGLSDSFKDIFFR